MPFRIVQQLKYTGGEASSGDKFAIVLDDGNTLIGGIAYTEYPATALCLHKDHWPEEVAAACTDLFMRLSTKYPDSDVRIEGFTAWIRTTPSNELVIGTPGLAVEVRFGTWHEHRTVTYNSTVVDLRPLS